MRDLSKLTTSIFLVTSSILMMGNELPANAEKATFMKAQDGVLFVSPTLFGFPIPPTQTIDYEANEKITVFSSFLTDINFDFIPDAFPAVPRQNYNAAYITEQGGEFEFAFLNPALINEVGFSTVTTPQIFSTNEDLFTFVNLAEWIEGGQPSFDMNDSVNIIDGNVFLNSTLLPGVQVGLSEFMFSSAIPSPN